MRWSVLLYVMAWVSAAGCAADASPEARFLQGGSLSLALSATNRDGDTFRLRDATFHLAGCSDDAFPTRSPIPGTNETETLYASECTDVTLSTEDHLNQSLITRRLLPGNYSVILAGDWYLERQNASGPWTRVERVVLLSPYFQQIYVRDGAAEQMSYVFGVGGDPIDFRHGDLNIRIQVELSDEDAGAAGEGG